MSRSFAAVLLVLLLTTSCNTVPTDVLGTAYVAPQTLAVRRELTQKNNNVALLHHGDRVYILDSRRRFLRVRTAGGLEGWVDAVELMTPQEMERIQHDSAEELKLPSEGRAGVYDPLNMHLDPSRISPAFARIAEGGIVDVIGHKLAPRTTGPLKAPAFNLQRIQPARKSSKHKEVKSAFPFPKLAAPKPPPGADDAAIEAQIEAKAQNVEPAKPTVLEDWSLVRTKDSQVGWVLSRNLMMGIPDEVAQYGEGKHITSYFDLGQMQDEEKGLKHNWLWTTSSGQEPYDFDSWRVFIWNRRRHRYETSFRERNVEGYFPVRVEPAENKSMERTFSLVMKEDDGKLWRQTYHFDGVRVHLGSKEPYDGAAPEIVAGSSSSKPGVQSGKGWFATQWQSLKNRFSGAKNQNH